MGEGSASPRGLDHDAAEVGDFAALALHHHAPQRQLQIAARDAAQAAIAQEHGLVGAAADQRIVDAGGAEFVDHHGGAAAFFGAEKALQQRGLAGAEKSGDHGHRHAMAPARA